MFQHRTQSSLRTHPPPLQFYGNALSIRNAGFTVQARSTAYAPIASEVRRRQAKRKAAEFQAKACHQEAWRPVSTADDHVASRESETPRWPSILHLCWARHAKPPRAAARITTTLTLPKASSGMGALGFMQVWSSFCDVCFVRCKRPSSSTS